jgi:two-component system repressor protein LuxO
LKDSTDGHGGTGGLTPDRAGPEKFTLPDRVAGDNDSCNPGQFIGTSAAMRALYTTIEKAASSRAAVFITGDSGTGKDVCARTIHRLSPRADKPFVAINCAAIPHDLIESELFGHTKGAFTGAGEHRDGAIARAQGGSLFLDEICDMPAAMQSKLLRFLQDLTYARVGADRHETADVRILCATNKNPRTEIERGHFREDLFYRLHVVPVVMPPLAGRGDDILDLACYFLHLYAAEEKKDFQTFTAQAEGFLRHYHWPGNVRELQNMIRYLVVMHDGPVVEESMLRAQATQTATAMAETSPSSLQLQPLWQIEKQAIEQAIALCHGNIPQAAALLEISPSTIYRKKQAWDNL